MPAALAAHAILTWRIMMQIWDNSDYGTVILYANMVNNFPVATLMAITGLPEVRVKKRDKTMGQLCICCRLNDPMCACVRTVSQVACSSCHGTNPSNFIIRFTIKDWCASRSPPLP